MKEDEKLVSGAPEPVAYGGYSYSQRRACFMGLMDTPLAGHHYGYALVCTPCTFLYTSNYNTFLYISGNLPLAN